MLQFIRTNIWAILAAGSILLFVGGSLLIGQAVSLPPLINERVSENKSLPIAEELLKVTDTTSTKILDSSVPVYSPPKQEVIYDRDERQEGYDWAEENNIENFGECDDEFGAGTENEDGCNEYVQEQQFTESPSFYGNECTEDCSGHEAGYQWAEENGIDTVDNCGGNSSSFIEGCESYVIENE